MSLLYFHAVLIVTAIIFGFGFGFWEMNLYQTAHQVIDAVSGIGSLAAAAALCFYLAWFVKDKLTGIKK